MDALYKLSCSFCNISENGGNISSAFCKNMLVNSLAAAVLKSVTVFGEMILLQTLKIIKLLLTYCKLL